MVTLSLRAAEVLRFTFACVSYEHTVARPHNITKLNFLSIKMSLGKWPFRESMDPVLDLIYQESEHKLNIACNLIIQSVTAQHYGGTANGNGTCHVNKHLPLAVADSLSNHWAPMTLPY